MVGRKKFTSSYDKCCVNGCKSVRNKTKNLMYHSFPKPGQEIKVTDNFGNVRLCERRKMWETNLRMTKKISDYMTVCSLHFRSIDYTCSGWSSMKRLMRTAIPTENLPKDSSEPPLQFDYDTNRDKYPKLQKDITQTGKNEQKPNRLITEIMTTAEISNSQDSNEVDKKETSTLDRGIEFVDVNSIDNSNVVVKSEPIDYNPNVFESVNIKVEYDSENDHYEHLTDEHQQENITKTEIDVKEEIM